MSFRQARWAVLIASLTQVGCGHGEPSASGLTASVTSSETAHGGGSSAPVTAASTALLAPTAQATAPSVAPSGAAAAAGTVPRPFAGAPESPGPAVEIPSGFGYSIAPPAGWKVEKDTMKGYVLLRPPSGTAAVLAAGMERYSVIDIRMWQFLDATLTGGPTWGAETSGVVGASAIKATLSRGKGYRFLPGGKRETRELAQILVPLADKQGVAHFWVVVFGMWNAAEPALEKGVVETMKSLR